MLRTACFSLARSAALIRSLARSLTRSLACRTVEYFCLIFKVSGMHSGAECSDGKFFSFKSSSFASLSIYEQLRDILKQVAQRHQEVSGTLALPLAVVLKLDIGRAVDPIGNFVL